MSTKNPHKKLGHRIKHVMSLTNELQKKIAERAGCQPTEISRWIRGEVAPNYTKLASIGRACKLSPEGMSWLFDGKGKSPDYPGYSDVKETSISNQGDVAPHTGDTEEGESANVSKSKSLPVKTGSNAHLDKKRKEHNMDLLDTKDELIGGLKDNISLLKEKVAFLEEELSKKSGAIKKVNGV